ncbi:MAG: hypothetical protein FWD69_05660 [Polyangiaceae bacterium]|nr:hypothetical protein [Polyangiaceae bacterium]
MMPNSTADVSDLITSRDPIVVGAAAPDVVASGVMPGVRAARELRRAWSRLSDQRLAWLIGTVLFVVCAWPLALVQVPPLQDLPNHLAAVTVIEHPSQYPEFVFNGFFKTNAALFAWLFVVGKITGLDMAARLFALVVLAGNAFSLPRFVLAITGCRRRMLVASLFIWPMVHNWFFSMGMLDFAAAIPLSLELLMALDRQRHAPTVKNGLYITALGIVTWYAHVFPLLIVHMLVAIEAALKPTWKERLANARAMVVPLVPVTLLVTASLYQQMSDAVGPMTGFIDHKKTLPPWELCYNMWAEWLWGFSKKEASSIVPCLVLAAIGIWRRKESPAFFSPVALGALTLLYCFLPYIMTNWFHVNSRVIPYLWIALLLRVPDTIPRKLSILLGVSAVVYSAGLGADYTLLERERQEFTAGISAVPEGARLLPLLFKHKEPGANTRAIMHAWGYYVTEKLTAAPLLFAHSHSFPVMYSTPPPVRFNQLMLDGFAPSMAQPGSICRNMLDGGVTVDNCEGVYDAAWREFWNDAVPRYDHLLIWDVTPEARAHIPSTYALVFEQGRLQIYKRH